MRPPRIIRPEAPDAFLSDNLTDEGGASLLTAASGIPLEEDG
jgi:hypothetical protein